MVSKSQKKIKEMDERRSFNSDDGENIEIIIGG